MGVNVVNVVYATDFARVGGGGIQSFVRSVGVEAPANVRVRYVGVGPLSGDLPRPQDDFVALLDGAPRRGPLNLAFARALARRGDDVLDGAPTVLHRAEYALAVRTHPVLLMLHGGTSFALRAKPTPFSMAYPLLEAAAAARVDTVLSVVNDQHWRPTSRVASLSAMPTCFDARTFRAGTDEVRPRLVTAARLVREKRVELILDAAAELGWPVTVIGDGPERADLEFRAAASGVEATFTGHLAPASVAALYRKEPSVFVLASRFEGFPVALLEAAGCGLPVVGLQAPGLARAVQALGGQVAPSVDALPAAARTALAVGNGLSATEVAALYASPAVGRRFWSHVTSMKGS